MAISKNFDAIDRLAVEIELNVEKDGKFYSIKETVKGNSHSADNVAKNRGTLVERYVGGPYFLEPGLKKILIDVYNEYGQNLAVQVKQKILTLNNENITLD